CRRERRETPILRIEKQGGSIFGQSVAGLELDACGVPGALADGLFSDRLGFAFCLSFDVLPREGICLFVAQDCLVLEVIGPLKRRRCYVILDPLQVGVAPRRLGWLPLCSAGLRGTGLSGRGGGQEQKSNDRVSKHWQKSATHMTRSVVLASSLFL